MTIEKYITALRQRITASGYTPAEATWCIRDIFAVLRGWSHSQLLMNGDHELSDQLRDAVDPVVAKIESGVPLQYALGETRFCGLRLKVTPATLIPRPETEQLVDMITDSAAGIPDLRVLDIGTGSGCIAVALARALRSPHVAASDISDAALDVARENARMPGVRVDFRHEDILKAVPQVAAFDIIVSNPPYITPAEKSHMSPRVLDYEPSGALFVPQDDPTLYYKAIARYAAVALAPGGSLWLEINPLFDNQTVEAVRAAGFTDAELIRDERGLNRFIRAAL